MQTVAARDEFKRQFNLDITIIEMSHLIIIMIFSIVLSFGWFSRAGSYLSPEDGVGYYLGIVGGSLMLLLLLYTFRKKYRFMRNWGDVKYWFSAHMIMGGLGPILILFHANFSMGSLNSSLALWSMIIVASSGLFGRYFYKKIHFGLYGRHASLNELKDVVKLNKGQIGKNIKLRSKSIERLSKFEKFSLHNSGMVWNLSRLPAVSILGSFIYFLVSREVYSLLKRYKNKNVIDDLTYKKAKNQVRILLKKYISSVSQLSGFTAYVTLFSVWHHLHFPLFLIMIVTGVVHVIVVHVY